MRVDVLTLFPGWFASPLSESLLGRAADAGLLDVRLVDLRLFAEAPHRKVDDEPYGGGPGMVLAAPPLAAALDTLRAEDPPPHVVSLSPQGRRLTNAVARELAARPRLVLVCGRYEGVDDRVREAGYLDEEISLGDFVLSGGEVAAVALLEAVSRFVPGVVGDGESVTQDSFEDGLLDTPHYTRPREFRGLSVPEVLLSGNHAAIRRWRRERQLEATWRRRPDLLATARLDDEDRRFLEALARKGVSG